MASKKKPPDKYRCLKLPVTSILFQNKENETQVNEQIDTLENAIIRTNAITSKTYFLLRLWILHKYHNNQVIPDITEDTISMCMKSVLIPSSGQKPKGNNLVLFQEFQQLNDFKLEDGCNLSSILDYYSTTMITAIENNIKMRFFDYIKRFVNSYFKHIYQDQLSNKIFKKQLYKELNLVKNDIINNTLTCDDKYHTWMSENRFKIVPQKYDTSYYYDIKATPHKYLKNMIFMCLELEKIEKKSFQFFPIQTNVIPRHIQIDTKALIELFVDTEKHKEQIDVWITETEEIKTGTIELLSTRPVTDLQIVLGKYFASLFLVVFSIAPTLLYFYSIYQLGSPKGNMDIGATWGSYIGLIFLSATFVSIGIFTSSITANQIVAFILAVFLCFFSYQAFDMLSKLNFFAGTFDTIVQNIGINYHYQSISRGVVDTRDALYFISFIIIFILMTRTSLQSRKW